MQLQDDLQITFLLKGDAARRFRAYKERENFMKDAEVARKLVADKLAEIESEPQRKPMARAGRAEIKSIVLETMREWLDEKSA